MHNSQTILLSSFPTLQLNSMTLGGRPAGEHREIDPLILSGSDGRYSPRALKLARETRRTHSDKRESKATTTLAKEDLQLKRQSTKRWWRRSQSDQRRGSLQVLSEIFTQAVNPSSNTDQGKTVRQTAQKEQPARSSTSGIATASSAYGIGRLSSAISRIRAGIRRAGVSASSDASTKARGSKRRRTKDEHFD